ncbi:hypothetical protein [Sutcliffiella horikoshii]|uniref:hypothetical protein n=1 Tax=Sutcliffiella horikoshii TaxID=79883 RepID=UPI001653BA50|nr:hypothetical protein [Sutcliffiella horikoshii]
MMKTSVTMKFQFKMVNDEAQELLRKLVLQGFHYRYASRPRILHLVQFLLVLKYLRKR